MSFLRSQLLTSSDWEVLARKFFEQWENSGFGNLDKIKLEALLAYCLHHQGVLGSNGQRLSLKEAHALNKEPSELDKLIAKGYTLFHKEPIEPNILVEACLRCLVSSKERLLVGSLEFHCVSELDKRYIDEYFERCGLLLERGRNSRILIIDLSRIDGSRFDFGALLYSLCRHLDIYPVEAEQQSSGQDGSWLLRCLQLTGPEIYKSGISVFARELLLGLFHHGT